MRTMIVLLIGIVVGAFCAFAAANALNKRHAHGRGTMIALAKHLDALGAVQGEAECVGDATRDRLRQIRFAALEIDYAFADLRARSPAFARRSAGFVQTAAQAATAVDGCRALFAHLQALERDCQACHRQFR